MSRCSSPTDFTLNMRDYLHGKEFPLRQDILHSESSTLEGEVEDDVPISTYQGLAEKSVIIDDELKLPSSFEQLSMLARALHAKCLQLQSNCAELNKTLQQEQHRHEEEHERTEKRCRDVEDTVAKRDATIESYIALVNTERERHQQEISDLEDHVDTQRKDKDTLDTDMNLREREDLQKATRTQQTRLEAAVRQLGESMTKNKELEEASQNTDAEVLRLHDQIVDAEKRVRELEEKLQSETLEQRTDLHRVTNEKECLLEELNMLREAEKAADDRVLNLEQQLKRCLLRHDDALLEAQDAKRLSSVAIEQVRKLQQRERQITETHHQEQEAAEKHWEARLQSLLEDAKQSQQQLQTTHERLKFMETELEGSREECRLRGKMLMHEWGKQECGTARNGEKQQYKYKY
ncbi:hypothetical protein K431DRAFT_343203 [Polychaeton citri CBS 116435]|uniref:Uncharacterized protein n=1 Tax=Polychaeton citri CBS 116435 TaxID=1314669 RepID=A0A9P4UUJ9_9PEZI|nr:hypothetical protein K431DRAFT_343203 [Polychaeton citri CBS 116435]